MKKTCNRVWLSKGRGLLWLVMALLCTLPVFSQQSRSNHEKYWYLRHRLKTQYLKVGLQEGESLPGGRRRVYPNTAYGDISYLDFGDGTIYLGWYIGVLATEINLLQASGQDYAATAEELYYALMAFDRLDLNSEILWSNWNGVEPDGAEPVNNDGDISEAPWNATTYNWTGTSQGLNGFFCRNDAPPYFETQFAPDEYDFIRGGVARLWDPTDPSESNNGEYSSEPPYVYRNVSYSHGGSEASQDQIFNLLMGFLLTHEFASGVTHNGIDLSAKAKVQALRIINHYNAAVEFRNPGRDEPCGNSNGCLPFNGGGSSYIFAYPMAIFAHYLDQGVPYMGWPAQDVYDGTGNNPYWNYWSPAAGSSKLPWRAWSFVTSAGDGHVNNHLRMMMAALSNSYDDIGDGPLKLYTWGTTDDIGWEFYFLLNKALYPNNSELWDGLEVRDELAMCPCEGPHNLPDDVPDNWSLSNRYVFGYKSVPLSDSYFQGEYNGLDYMLLYNLFAIVYSNYNGASYTNHIDRKLNVGAIYPTGGGYGSVSEPETFIAFKTLETNMVINGPIGSAEAGDITLKAGQKITLLPGFNAKAGSDFLAHIDGEFECDANGFYKRTPLTNPVSEYEREEAEKTNRLIGEAYTRRAENISSSREGNRFFVENMPDYSENVQRYAIEPEASVTMEIGPNPTNLSFALRFDAAAVMVRMLRLYDAQGVLLEERNPILSGEPVDISHLPAGNYRLLVNYTDQIHGESFKTFTVIKM